MAQKLRHFSILDYVSQRQTNAPEKGIKLQLKRSRLDVAKNLYSRDLRGHFGCVNAIEFSPCGGEYIASGGDDKRVLLWNVEKVLSNVGKPDVFKGEHNSNIFCLAFDVGRKKIFSGGNDEQVIVHDIESKETVDVYKHEEAVYGLSADPLNESIVASACDDGRVLVIDVRQPASEEPFCLAQSISPMHAVMYNPVEPRLLVTANSKDGIMLWDIRQPRKYLLHYGSQQSSMSVRISSDGRRVLALRRRLPPVLYNLHSREPLCQFDHPGYYNSCTMKSCCFAGEKDEYILSGSDDFNIYLWEIPEEPHEIYLQNRAHIILRGHRSIVNQVRYNSANQMIVSSGVEKILKLWSPYGMNDARGGLDYESLIERPIYSHDEYINLVLRDGQNLTHDYSNGSVDEDPRMMAFFDSLVQRELQGWSTDEENSDSDSSSASDGYLLFLPSDESTDSDLDLAQGQGVTVASINPIISAALAGLENFGRRPSENNSEGGAAQSVDHQSVLNELTGRIFLETMRSMHSNDVPSATAAVNNVAHSSTSSIIGSEQDSSASAGSNAARNGISQLIEQKRKEYVSNLQEMARRAKAERNGESSSAGLDYSQHHNHRRKRRRMSSVNGGSYTAAGCTSAINAAYNGMEQLRQSSYSSSSEDLNDWQSSSSSDDEQSSSVIHKVPRVAASSDDPTRVLSVPDASRNTFLNKLRRLRSNSRSASNSELHFTSNNRSSAVNDHSDSADGQEGTSQAVLNPQAVRINDDNIQSDDLAYNKSDDDNDVASSSARNRLLAPNGSTSTAGYSNGDDDVSAISALGDIQGRTQQVAAVIVDDDSSLNVLTTDNVRWEEFRRFKHQLERVARRMYRRRSQSGSGDERPTEGQATTDANSDNNIV